ncbi:T9SS type A sorting domain-containing protein [Neolewinella agarilytica]|uniref:Por secretion system C-terminal sorting domain-containing protein n=1 Tax=Neolewinella agarilytica TaxID=478744 RepID=A0A1H9F4Y4_9BACT|nr:T9SS type A sorting domain-containing protein [Neolewinella agarilytica]SEQ33044.1 Por secretion system C-terminal sorting domain-containing protein [Neolewinella agarilytica]
MRLTLLFLFTLALTFLHAQTTLAVGDLAVVGYAADSPDEVCIVALVEIDAGTMVNLTDKGWQSDDTFISSEGAGSVTLPAMTFGDVFCIEGSDLPTSFNLSGSGDQIMLYTGTEASPTFIYAFQLERSSWTTSGTITTNTSYVPTGTIEGTTAVNIGAIGGSQKQNAYYSGPDLVDKAAALALIADGDNWTGNDARVDPSDNLPVNLSVLLPVSLSNLSASLTDKSVLVKWSTATESENDFFAVERSLDGQTFSEIGRVASEGTTTEVSNYSFMDENPANGTSYYRLRQVDLGGTQAIYGPVAVSLTGLSVTAYPNPASQELFLAGLKENTTATVLDINGRVLQTAQVSGNSLNVSQLKTGTYLLRLESETGTETLRFVRK